MYHYTESGLQNIYLENGFAIHKTPHGKGVAISDAAGLHRAIGRAIAVRPRLTGAELRFLRKEMELSQRALGELVGATEQNVSLWERRGHIPKTAARLLKLLYLSRLDGNVQVCKAIDALIELDEHREEQMRFNSRKGHWRNAA
jgi:putative transcriptional regulator